MILLSHLGAAPSSRYRMLDLFCGRWGWSRAFAAHDWECVGVDIAIPAGGGMDSNFSRVPRNCKFLLEDVLNLRAEWIKPWNFDFICASSPCEEFSVHGMRHFHPNPKYPREGIRLFNHTRAICEESGVPYVMENVRAAQQFVGNAVNHCGPFYLWGSGVPPLMPQGVNKGTTLQMAKDAFGKRIVAGPRKHASGSKGRAEEVAKRAEIPPELANCVADYAERIVGDSRDEAQAEVCPKGENP